MTSAAGPLGSKSVFFFDPEGIKLERLHRPVE
jgi:hypothetical protein